MSLDFATFGELLRHLRRRAGLTQRDLGQAVGYSETQITRLENGQRLPDVTMVKGSFVEALDLKREPELANRLIELAAKARGGTPPTRHEQELGVRVRSRTNLPAQLTSFIGREHEIAEVKELLGTTRLLTLIGAGGVGKTRLARETAAGLLNSFPDGVWYVELAALTDPTVIADVVVRAFGLAASDEPAQPRVLDFLHERHVLLVLDNCEHLVDDVAEFAAAMLQACPRVTILATSRETLNVEGETVWRVPPMQPDEAGQLFVARGAAARSDATLSARDETILRICQRLDGMPLAIELAAARLNAMSLSDIAKRLDDRFNLLAGGRRGALPRHRTLRALIDWSYDALSESEKVVFRRLGVFVGGWELEQAEQVVSDDVIHQSDVGTLLTQLVSKSLVVMDDRDAATRYRLLETVREYAREYLYKYDEQVIFSRRHANAFATLSERSIPYLHGKGQKEWIQRLNRETSNVRGALTWGFGSQGDTVIGSRIVAALAHYWNMSSGNFREVRRWYAEALQTLTETTPTQVRANVLTALSYLNPLAESLPTRIDYAQTALMLYRRIDDKSDMAFLLCNLGDMQITVGLHDEGATNIEQGIALARERGNDWVMRFGIARMCDLAYLKMDVELAKTLNERLAQLCRDAGDAQLLAESLTNLVQFAMDELRFDKACNYAEEARLLADAVGDESNSLNARMRLAQATYYLGDLQSAQTMLEECLSQPQRLGYWMSVVKILLARVTNAAGDHPRAQQLLMESFDTARQTVGIQNHRGGELLDFMACVAVNRVDMHHAGHLFGAGEAIYASINSFRLARHEWEFAPYIAKARSALGDEAYDAAYAEGRTMTLEQAIEYALADQREPIASGRIS